ncbi:ras guanine nucleotide exchange factor i-related [Anaeramoeba flamelloides]|uniref:Ras guanine nucleotide exchange factor i-related n=1 Tax=Anaeramoeba flamelloides TaxID=1746091 RepID=A0AAV8A9Y5_9EUKA|nr:ras guanine nucleotide exchange factor i-related [Anaeramoeba flamelloides]
MRKGYNNINPLLDKTKTDSQPTTKKPPTRHKRRSFQRNRAITNNIQKSLDESKFLLQRNFSVNQIRTKDSNESNNPKILLRRNSIKTNNQTINFHKNKAKVNIMKSQSEHNILLFPSKFAKSKATTQTNSLRNYKGNYNFNNRINRINQQKRSNKNNNYFKSQPQPQTQLQTTFGNGLVKKNTEKEKEKEQEKGAKTNFKQSNNYTANTTKETSNNQAFIEKSLWLAHVMKRNPDLLEMRERSLPLTHEPSFGKLVRTGITEMPDRLGGRILIELINEFLESKNFTESTQSLREESNFETQKNENSQERLTLFLKMVVKDVNKIWDLNFENCIERIVKASDQVKVDDRKTFLLEEEDDEEFQDINIWDEPEDNKGNILFNSKGDNKQENLKGATLNKLIEKLTGSETEYLDFIPIFLMTYQSFTSPGRFLSKLFQRFQIPSKIKSKFQDEKGFEQYKTVIRLRTVSLLKTWLENHFSDFNEGLLSEVDRFIQTELRGSLRKLFTEKLLKQINSRIPMNTFQKITPSEPPPEPKVPKNIFSKNLKLFDIDEIEIARQITLIDFEIFSQIKPAELLNCAWSKDKLKHRAKNVLHFILRFNQLSNWFSKLILDHEKVKVRAKVLTKVINIAERLYQLNNFNSLYSVLSCIESSSIYRLNFTLEEISTKHIENYQSMKQFMSNEGSFKIYRENLKKCDLPCIPYLGIYCSDLVFIEDGNPDWLDGKLINLSKRRFVYQVISRIQRFQHTSYNFHPVHQIAQLLKNFPQTDPKIMYSLSLLREPRGAKKNEIK